ncbi:MAG: DNA alkylation repair protein [Rothia sp. (in: high G+C Gram-positive bacteria)]|nr:DNA alkylation repair protein [Rothia sp. (in: high G+C Gram-positive bacteria)]
MNFTAHCEAFQAAADPQAAPAMEAYMRNQFEFLGLPTPQRRALLKPFLTDAKKEAKTTGIDKDFVEQCWAQSAREFQYNALDYLAAVKAHLQPADIPWLRSLIERKSWWDTIDRLDLLVGDVLWRHPDDQLILTWAKDENFWVRRVAIDHQRPRKVETNTALLEEIILLNLGSKEFFINKAIGWALREYSKANPAWVADFIDRHRSALAPLSVREGSKRLPD